MTEFINPFPPLGQVRVWREEYLQAVSKSIPDLTWKNFGTIAKVNLDSCPKCSGVYAFVWHSSIGCLTPFAFPSSSIVYVGRAENLRKRINDYIDDKKAIERHRTSERKIRDPISIMLREYGSKLELFYTEIEPGKIVHYEDTLIKLFDPIFNTEQKLKQELFENFEEHLAASFDVAEEPFKMELRSPKISDAPKEQKIGSSFGESHPAF